MKKLIFILLFGFFSSVNSRNNDQSGRVDSLKNLLAKTTTDSLKVKIQDQLSFIYSNIDPAQGLRYADSALAISSRSGWVKGIALAYADLAINYESNSNHPKALYWNLKALNLNEKLGNKRSISGILANMSLIYMAQGNYQNSLKYAFRALTLTEELEDTKSMAIILENIGTIYLERKDYAKTSKYYNAALKAYEALNDKEGIARNLGNKGIVLDAGGNYDEALICHFKALETNRQLGNTRSVQINYANIGYVYSHLNNFSMALEYQFKALEMSRQLSNHAGIAIDLGNIGETYFHFYEYSLRSAKLRPSARTALSKAIDYLEQASAICSEINFPAPQIEFTEFLSKAYALSGNHQKALQVHRLHTALKDTIFSIQNRIKISDLETQREMELKDKTIIIKNREIEIARLMAKTTRDEKLIYVTGIILLLIALFLILRKYMRRKKTHLKELASKDAKLRRTQAIGHLGHWDLNLETGVVVMSDEACRIYGLTRDEKRQHFESWYSFIYPEDLDYVKGRIIESREGLNDFKIFHRIIRRDGEVRHVYTEGRYEVDKNKKTKGIFGIVFDNTQIKEHEVELQELLNISNRQNEKLKNFAYIVSHNIRSHSANIYSITDFLGKTIDEESRSMLFEMLGKSSRNLLDTIENLNQIITIQDKITEKTMTICLRDEVDKISHSISREIAETNTTLLNEVPADIQLETIPAYLDSILLNIISNSIRYRSPERDPVIHIAAVLRNNNVLLSISDNGMGIDLKKYGEKIFGLYKTFHNNPGARGFGLYLTKNHIEALGGQIEIESEPDKGTTIRILF